MLEILLGVSFNRHVPCAYVFVLFMVLRELARQRSAWTFLKRCHCVEEAAYLTGLGAAFSLSDTSAVSASGWL